MDAVSLARALDISKEASALYLQSHVIDLHIDTYIWQRLFGYDLTRRHGRGPFGARIFGQADLPRVLDAGFTGALWIITTNPFRSRRGRRDACLRNLARLRALLSSDPRVALVASATEYQRARHAGRHAAWIGLQGGNALELSLDDFDRPEAASLALVTLLHFTRSRIGAPALPRWLSRGDPHLSAFGVDYVRKLNEKRILVDLAHISRPGFDDAVRAHDRSLPFVVSHAACDAVRPHFRNLTDPQLRAVADHGGVVGIIFNAGFVGPSIWRASVGQVVDHIAHVIRTVGEDHVALGSDFDGAIIPPRDMRTVLEVPRLVQCMLDRGFRESAVRKLLGSNFLRVLAQLRA